MSSCLTPLLPYSLTPWFDADGEENPRSKWSDTGREKAARGEDGLYPWGNSAPEHDLAYFDHADAGTTSQIGRRPGGASIYGCHDLAGNVWEWTLDSFNDERELHVLKGGSWQNPATHLENGARLFSYPPAKRRTYMGFRVVYLPADLYATYMAAYEQR